MPNDPDPSRERQISSDRNAIQTWAEDHDAVPVRDTAASDAPLRIVPEHQADTYDPIEWDAFFDELDHGDHVVVYHGEAADDPLEVTGRDDLVGRVEDDEEFEERLMEGETVTSAITETRVVESVVVEELTIESELVDAEVVESDVVDAELVDLTCTDCRLDTMAEFDAMDWFDTDRYLEGIRTAGPLGAIRGRDTGTTDTPPTGAETTATATDAPTEAPPDTTEASTATGTPPETAETSTERTETSPETPESSTATDTPSETTDTRRETTPTGTTAESTPLTTGGTRHALEGTTGTIEDADELPYQADLEVEETWSILRDVTERYVVQSQVTDKAVTEADTIEDYDLEATDLHRSIVEQELFETERPSDEVLAHYDVESELSDTDVIETTFTRQREVEDRVLDRKRLDASFAGGEFLGMEILGTRASGTEPTAESTTGAGATDATTSGAPDADTAAVSTDDEHMIDEDAIGKTVLNAQGDEIGMVSDVDESTSELYVDVEPGMAERIMATLGWSDADEGDYPLGADAVKRITDDEVMLKGHEEIEESGTRPGDTEQPGGDRT